MNINIKFRKTNIITCYIDIIVNRLTSWVNYKGLNGHR